MNLNKIACVWGSVWYYSKVFKKKWVDVLIIASLSWLVLKAIWVMMIANVRLAAMGL